MSKKQAKQRMKELRAKGYNPHKVEAQSVSFKGLTYMQKQLLKQGLHTLKPRIKAEKTFMSEISAKEAKRRLTRYVKYKTLDQRMESKGLYEPIKTRNGSKQKYKAPSQKCVFDIR